MDTYLWVVYDENGLSINSYTKQELEKELNENLEDGKLEKFDSEAPQHFTDIGSLNFIMKGKVIQPKVVKRVTEIEIP